MTLLSKESSKKIVAQALRIPLLNQLNAERDQSIELLSAIIDEAMNPNEPIGCYFHPCLCFVDLAKCGKKYHDQAWKSVKTLLRRGAHPDLVRPHLAEDDPMRSLFESCVPKPCTPLTAALKEGTIEDFSYLASVHGVHVTKEDLQLATVLLMQQSMVIQEVERHIEEALDVLATALPEKWNKAQVNQLAQCAQQSPRLQTILQKLVGSLPKESFPKPNMTESEISVALKGLNRQGLETLQSIIEETVKGLANAPKEIKSKTMPPPSASRER
jgi:hypothetical protein